MSDATGVSNDLDEVDVSVTETAAGPAFGTAST
jgi:hypothetical protein